MATIVSIATAPEVCSPKEHPLQWLQPTPEIPALAALCLPPLCRRGGMDGEAMSGASWDSHGISWEVLSDASTSTSVHDEGLRQRCWRNSGLEQLDAAAREPVAQPPQLSPCISSLPPPPPPPAHCPSAPSSPMPLQTPSPVCAYATSSGLPPAARKCEPSQLAPTLLQAMGSFATLDTWSASYDVYDDSSMNDQWLASESLETVQPTKTGGACVEQPSRGSALHCQGKCKPCAFVHRATGCADGSDCSFCHLCGPGEKKRRQKQKFERIQQRRSLRKVATSTTFVEPASKKSCSFFVDSSTGTPAPR